MQNEQANRVSANRVSSAGQVYASFSAPREARRGYVRRTKPEARDKGQGGEAPAVIANSSSHPAKLGRAGNRGEAQNEGSSSTKTIDPGRPARPNNSKAYLPNLVNSNI